jgi:hypothetical protein
MSCTSSCRYPSPKGALPRQAWASSPPCDGYPCLHDAEGQIDARSGSNFANPSAEPRSARSSFSGSEIPAKLLVVTRKSPMPISQINLPQIWSVSQTALDVELTRDRILFSPAPITSSTAVSNCRRSGHRILRTIGRPVSANAGTPGTQDLLVSVSRQADCDLSSR